ncbi:MAG TPA: Abi-alpha family protein [Vicinamibacterales bacterium]|nr:Abi-alpha family protein [Vicinamibacterales bacterium]
MDPVVVAAAVGFLAGRGGSFIDAVFKPLATRLGDNLLDRFKNNDWTGSNMAETAVATQEMLDAAGIIPVPAPMRILIPLLDYASFEEDAELRRKYAALLANAVSPGPANRILPGYAEILRQLTPDEARILDYFYDTWKRGPGAGVPLITGNLKISEVDTRLFLSDLARLRLIEGQDTAPKMGSFIPESPYDLIQLTSVGASFVEACRPPQPTPAP